MGQTGPYFDSPVPHRPAGEIGPVRSGNWPRLRSLRILPIDALPRSRDNNFCPRRGFFAATVQPIGRFRLL